MKTLNAPDTISGKEGRAYAKVNGNNEELFMSKTIEATVEKSKSEVKAIGKRMTGHKTTGGNGTGSMTLYYLTPLFQTWSRPGRKPARTSISTWWSRMTTRNLPPGNSRSF